MKIIDQFDYFLFDWDGCLAQTLQAWLGAYREVFNHFNIKISDKEIGMKVFGDVAFDKNYPEITDVDYLEKVLSETKNKIIQVQLSDGVKEMLEGLKLKDKKLAIVTSSRREFINAGLVFHNIKPYFDAVVSGDDVTVHKPDPEALNLAMKSLKVSDEEKNRVVMIGDSYRDIQAGNAAGVGTILYHDEKIHNLFYDFDHLMSFKPDHIISSFKEILNAD